MRNPIFNSYSDAANEARDLAASLNRPVYLADLGDYKSFQLFRTKKGALNKAEKKAKEKNTGRWAIHVIYPTPEVCQKLYI